MPHLSANPKVLVLGASGMLGHTVFRYLSERPRYAVVGSVRSREALGLLPMGLRDRLVLADLESGDDLSRLFEQVQPNVVINCVGVVKQLVEDTDITSVLLVNSVLPHRLLRQCRKTGARLVHVSTDCVFSGSKGQYSEREFADSDDLYGRSKLLGEVDDAHGVTLRTSIIGPELGGSHGLLGWFLSQQGRVRGFTHAIFSGLPTVELARVLDEFVLPSAQLRGIYHVSAEPISKYELLRLFGRTYGRTIAIEPDGALKIDRSLDGRHFREQTGYVAPPWPELVRAMHDFG